MSDDNNSFPEENNDIGAGDQSFPDESNIDETPSIQEPMESEQSDEGIQEEKPKQKKGRVPGKTRINQLIREKYEAENETQALRAENERLKKLQENANNAAMAHYDNSVQLKMDRAKQLKAQAIEIGDVSAQVDADVELSRVAAQMEQLDAWKAQQSHKQREADVMHEQQQHNNQQQYQTPDLNEETEEWLQENPWFDPRTSHYDADMQAEVKAYADALDRKLIRSGQEDKIMTREYFDAINGYVQKEFYNDEPRQNRNLNMKSARGAQVAPVGNRAASGTPNSVNPKIILSAEEKDLIRLGKIDEKEFIRQKALIMKNAQTRGEQRRG